MNRKRWFALFGRAFQEYSADNCSHAAAGISYYVLFAVFPLLIFLAGVTGLVLRDADRQADVVDEVFELIPISEDQGREDLVKTVEDLGEGSSGVIGLLGLVAAAWGGSSMFAAVRRGIHTAYDCDSQRPLVRQKMFDLGMVAALAPFFIGSIAVSATLAFARSELSDTPLISVFAGQPVLWFLVGLALTTGISFAAFLVMYVVVPVCHVAVRDAWPAALLAAVLFEAAKAGFSFYLAHLGNYDAVFGALGAGAIFLVWVNLTANILLFGAEVASEYPRARAGELDPDPDAKKAPLKERALSWLRGLFVSGERPTNEPGQAPPSGGSPDSTSSRARS